MNVIWDFLNILKWQTSPLLSWNTQSKNKVILTQRDLGLFEQIRKKDWYLMNNQKGPTSNFNFSESKSWFELESSIKGVVFTESTFD